MTPAELKTILAAHQLWLANEGGKRADLSRTNLIEMDLTDVNLASANLTEANLAGANLAEADLSRANLAWANLTEANLTGANLNGANLIGVNLIKANLKEIKKDFFRVLDAAPNEICELEKALLEGRIDGSVYDGECACLIGTIAKVAKVYFRCIPNLAPNAYCPAERWFLAIQEGDTPASNPLSAITAGWIKEWKKKQ